MIYLDNGATAPVRREVLEAMWPFLTAEFGNPSSHHAVGERAREALTGAREAVASLLGCRASEVLFTSGGTEADNLAIKGIALASPRGRHIITSAIEHEAVLGSCDYLCRHHGFTVTQLEVDRFGTVHPDSLRESLRADTTLTTIMLANNEVGTIQPVATLAELTHQSGVPMHTDAVQAAGSLPLNVGSLRVDAMSLSGHKIGAPKGVGVLYLRGRLMIEPVLHGGGQERGRRSGTENVAGAVGFAHALALSEQDREQRTQHLSLLRDALIQGVLHEVPEAMLTGHATQRLAGNASFCFPGTSGEAILLQLAERDIICSSGSACAAGRDDPSHVLVAMGFARALAQTAVRFTLHQDVTPDEIAHVVRAVRESWQAVRALAH